VLLRQDSGGALSVLLDAPYSPTLSVFKVQSVVSGGGGGGGDTIIVDAPPATSTSLGTVQLAGDLNGTAEAPTVPGLADKVPLTAIGVPGGLATLGLDGKVPSGELPPPAAGGIPEALVDAKGDLLAGTAADTVARVGVGSSGQVLSADPATTSGLRWVDVPGSGGGIAATLIDAAGDLIVGTAPDTAGRLPRGASGQVLGIDGTSGLPAWVDMSIGAGADWVFRPLLSTDPGNAWQNAQNLMQAFKDAYDATKNASTMAGIIVLPAGSYPYNMQQRTVLTSQFQSDGATIFVHTSSPYPATGIVSITDRGWASGLRPNVNSYFSYTGKGSGTLTGVKQAIIADTVTANSDVLFKAKAGVSEFSVAYVITGAASVAVTARTAAITGVNGAASTDTFTKTAHGLNDGDPVVFSALPGGGAGGITLNVTYFARDTAANTFKVTATRGGTAVNVTSDVTGARIAGNAILVTGGTSSTANDVITAINASGAASPLVTPSLYTGAGANVGVGHVSTGSWVAPLQTWKAGDGVGVPGVAEDEYVVVNPWPNVYVHGPGHVMDFGDTVLFDQSGGLRGPRCIWNGIRDTGQPGEKLNLTSQVMRGAQMLAVPRATQPNGILPTTLAPNNYEGPFQMADQVLINTLGGNDGDRSAAYGEQIPQLAAPSEMSTWAAAAMTNVATSLTVRAAMNKRYPPTPANSTATLSASVGVADTTLTVADPYTLVRVTGLSFQEQVPVQAGLLLIQEGGQRELIHFEGIDYGFANGANIRPARLLNVARCLRRTGDSTVDLTGVTGSAASDTFTKTAHGLANNDVIVFTSLGASSVTGITASAATDVFTKTAHGLTNGTVVKIAAMTGGRGLALERPYYVVDATTNTFQLSKISGGVDEAFYEDATAVTVRRVHTNLTTGTPYYVVGSTANTFQVSLTLGGAAINFANDVPDATVNKPLAFTTSATVKHVELGLIGNELFAYTQWTDTTVTIAARGLDGTTAVAYDYDPGDLKPVYYVAPPGRLVLRSEVQESPYTPQGARLKATTTSAIANAAGRSGPFTVTLSDCAQWPESGAFVVGSEVFTYEWHSNKTLYGVIGGMHGTTVASHAINLTAYSIPMGVRLSAAIDATQTAIPVNGADPYRDFSTAAITTAIESEVITLKDARGTAASNGQQTISSTLASQITGLTGVAATDIITATAHGLSNGTPVYFSSLTGGAGLAVSTTYYVIGATTNTFQLSATSGGSAVNFTTDISAASLELVPGEATSVTLVDASNFVDPVASACGWAFFTATTSNGVNTYGQYTGKTLNTLTGVVLGYMSRQQKLPSGTTINQTKTLNTISNGRPKGRAHTTGAEAIFTNGPYAQRILETRNVTWSGMKVYSPTTRDLVPRALAGPGFGNPAGNHRSAAVNWFCRDLNYLNFDIDGTERDGVIFNACIDFNWIGGVVENVAEQGEGNSTLFQGANQDGLVMGVKYRNVRHAGIIGAASDFEGSPRRIKFCFNSGGDSINSTWESQSSTGGDLLLEGNDFITGGITINNNTARIINNRLYNGQINLNNYCRKATYFVVEDNTLDASIDPAIAFGVDFHWWKNIQRTHVKIKGNDILNARGTAIRVQIPQAGLDVMPAGIQMRGVILENNTVVSIAATTPSTAGSEAAIYLDNCVRASVAWNKVRGLSGGQEGIYAVNVDQSDFEFNNIEFEGLSSTGTVAKALYLVSGNGNRRTGTRVTVPPGITPTLATYVDFSADSAAVDGGGNVVMASV
jgi:hypothetical protein